MATPKKLDLSSAVGDLFPEEDASKFVYVTADMGPMGEVRILQDLNTFLVIQSGEDAGAIVKTMASVIHPEDAPKVIGFLNKRKSMSAEQLMELYGLMLEATTGGRPTNSPSASSAGMGKKVVSKRSGASSSRGGSTGTP